MHIQYRSTKETIQRLCSLDFTEQVITKVYYTDSSYLMPDNAISLTDITALQILWHRNNITNANREKVYDPIQETQMQRICLRAKI